MSMADSSFASFAPQGASAGPRMATGTVCGRSGPWLFVRSEAGEQPAQIAASCLLQPEDGDLVLLCLSADLPPAEARDGTHALPCPHYVLAVLARADADQGSLLLPGGARLEAAAGRLRIESREIDLAASDALQARTPQLTVEAMRGDLRFGHANASAGSFTACLGELRLFARKISTQVDRLVQKARSSFRTVEELDDLRAGRTRWQVEGHAQLHARQATVLAEGVVKVDGQRIDLG